MNLLYLKLAQRYWLKYRLYSIVNILGLGLGLTILLLSQLLVRYETSHDVVFVNLERIFSIGSRFSAMSEEPISQYPGIRTIYAPHLREKLPDDIAIARSTLREVTINANNRVQDIPVRFTDPDFIDIFQFDLLRGSAAELYQGNFVLVTQSFAQSFFDSIDIVGKEILVNNKTPLIIAAVIEDPPQNTHFNSSFMPGTELRVISSMSMFDIVTGSSSKGSWQGLNPSNMTYVLLPENYQSAWLQEQVDELYEKITPIREKQYIDKLLVRPLSTANTQIWDALGMPVLFAIQLMGILVFLTVSINYLNLTFAQNRNREKEISLRQIYGASSRELWLQFATESAVVCVFSSIIALSICEQIIPIYNQMTSKAVVIDYALAGTVLVGAISFIVFASACYPLQSRLKNALLPAAKNKSKPQKGKNWFNNLLLTLQFAVANFLTALVFIVFFQNKIILEVGDDFPKQQVQILNKMDKVIPHSRFNSFMAELNRIADIESMSFSNGVPFRTVGELANVQNATGTFTTALSRIDGQFFPLYAMPFIIAPIQPLQKGDLVVNELFLARLGIESPHLAIGKTIQLESSQGEQGKTYTIVGVLKNQYFLGLHMSMRAYSFVMDGSPLEFLSIKAKPGTETLVQQEIETLWASHFPEFALPHQSLNDFFNLFYRIPNGIAGILQLFCYISLVLCLSGLFALTVYLAKLRTNEIGIRKVLGASDRQLVTLLLIDFTKPVLVAIALAMPLAYFASHSYLGFFPVQLGFILPTIFGAGLLVAVAAVLTASYQALKVAKTSPVDALNHR